MSYFHIDTSEDTKCLPQAVGSTGRSIIAFVLIAWKKWFCRGI